MRPCFPSLLAFVRGSATTTQRKTRLSFPASRARLRKTLKIFVDKTPWPPIPRGKLILVADALIEILRQRVWTIYFVLARPRDSNQAVILPPVLAAGTENSQGGWEKAFQKLPLGLKRNVLALICDGATTLVSCAKKQNWKIQRCHFHLRWRIANYVRLGPLSRHLKTGQEMVKLVEIILTSHDVKLVKRTVRELSRFRKTIASQGLKRVLSGLVKHYRDYRVYLDHPELNLPLTTNSVESLISQIRKLQYRARGFSSPESLFSWVVAFCKCQGWITCNGNKNQPN